MEYKIRHSTEYQYSSPVSVCHNVVMLAPQPNDFLKVNSHSLTIRPVPEIFEERRDIFNNRIHRFSLEEQHSKLKITSRSHIIVLPRQLPAAEKSPTCQTVIQRLNDRVDPAWLSVVPFLFDSPRIRRARAYAEFAAGAIQKDRPIIAAVEALTHQIYTEFKYDKDATQVDTPTKSAFEKRHGVCQDFAHVEVTCLRSLNIPARYVSGYLRTIPAPGKERLVGADQSHAWVSAYCGEESGWVDFDPTNDCICGESHVPIATGRDYSDVVPIKGVFLGGGKPALSVSVDVAPA